MNYQWDPEKSRANKTKHGVLFADAVSVFEDPLAITISDESVSDEQRYITVGTDGLGRLLVVVYTYRGSDIRIISARKATPGERRSYEGTA